MHYEKFADGTVKCIEEEIPFDVPDAWSWSRLENCCCKEIKRGKSPKYAENGSTLVFAQKCNTKYDGINIGLSLFLDDNTLNKYPDTEYMQNNDIVINSTGTGTLGRVGIYKDSHNAKRLPIVPDSHVTIIRAYKSLIADYVYTYMKAKQPQIEKMGEGSTNQKELKPLTLKKLLICIPPFPEQHRITEKLTELISFIDTIETGKLNLKETIQATKSKILDLAIRGKLVPQDPNDEPASVLLERISTEKEELIKQGKIKRDKKESVIFKGEDNSYYEKVGSEVRCIDEELPFEIPDNWEWVRLWSLFSHNTGKALNSKSQVGSPYKYITTSNLYWNRFELGNLKQMLFSESELEKCTVRKGDLLVCEGGDIGRSAIWNYDEEIRIQNHIHRLRPYTDLNVNFYYYTMYLYKVTDRINGKGIGIQGLSSNQLHTLPLPLPPLSEQQRITAKIKALFDILDSIENALIE